MNYAGFPFEIFIVESLLQQITKHFFVVAVLAGEVSLSTVGCLSSAHCIRGKFYTLRGFGVSLFEKELNHIPESGSISFKV